LTEWPYTWIAQCLVELLVAAESNVGRFKHLRKYLPGPAPHDAVAPVEDLGHLVPVRPLPRLILGAHFDYGTGADSSESSLGIG